MTPLETDLLAELIRQKHRCLARLRDLGGTQLQLIDEGNMTDLLKILSAKQQLISELDTIERRLDPFRDQTPESRRWRSPEDRRLCARQVQECDLMFSQIVAQEKQGEQCLLRRRDEVSARLDGIHATARAHVAYTGDGAPPVGQLDLSSES